jgi:hypothetical protein
MLFDSTNLFSDAQAITATAASTNVIDLGAADTPQHAANAITKDLAFGTPVEIFVQVVTAFTADGAGTLTVALQTDTVENFASPTALWTSAAIGKAALVPGYRFGIQFVPKGVERYLRLNYTVGTGPMTAGAITAGLVFAADARHV